jgi:hypothetical protein
MADRCAARQRNPKRPPGQTAGRQSPWREPAPGVTRAGGGSPPIPGSGCPLGPHRCRPKDTGRRRHLRVRVGPSGRLRGAVPRALLLNQAQTFVSGEATERYLNVLVARAYLATYGCLCVSNHLRM